MKVKKIEGLTVGQLNYELQRGGKLVTYQYCFSAIIMTFKRDSDIYLIKAGESAFWEGAKYTLFSLLFGWWGFPWGPIRTIEGLIINCSGGNNVTYKVMDSLNRQTQQYQSAGW